MSHAGLWQLTSVVEQETGELAARFRLGGWSLTLGIAPGQVVTDLRLTREGTNRGEGLSAAILRSLPLRELVNEATERATTARTDTADIEPGALVVRTPFGVATVPPADSVSPDLRYARVAQTYVALVESGVTQPAVHMAREMDVSLRTVRAWIDRARARGLLERPGSGPPGGALTRKARALLEDSSAGAYGAHQTPLADLDNPHTDDDEEGQDRG